MLSSECPIEFWRAIGRLTGWRLASHNEFKEGTFSTMGGDFVTVSEPIAYVLDALVCALGDLGGSSLELIDTVKLLMNGTRTDKNLAKKALADIMPRHRAEVMSLVNDMPATFRHYSDTEQKEDCAGCA